jgi:hypothetical protein
MEGTMAQALILYPRSLTELARHAIQLYLQNLRAVFLIELACVVAFVVGMLPVVLITALSFVLAAMYQSPAIVFVTVVLTIVATLAATVVIVACMYYLFAAATVAVTLNLRGLKANFGQIRRHLGRTVIVQIFGTGMLQIVAIILGFALLIIPGFIAMAWFAFSSPVVVIERLAYLSALQRSRELAQGQVLRILAATLCLIIVYMLATLVGEAVLGLVFPVTVARNTMSLALMFLYTPFQSIFVVLLYFDTRIRKGELGLEEISELA